MISISEANEMAREAHRQPYQSPAVKTQDDRPDWDTWFMSIASLVSMRSRDVSTKHGAVICDGDHRLIGVGYNGFPRGCDDSLLPTERPAKYDVMIHAEENCLLNSQNLLIGNNYTLYVTGMPCSRCMIKIMQFDVRRIVYGNVTSHCVDHSQINLVQNLANMKGISLYLSRFDCRKITTVMREVYLDWQKNIESLERII